MAEGEPQAAPPAGVGAKTDEGLEGHPIVKRLRERFPEAVMGVSCLGNKPDELTLLIKLEMIAEVCRFLKAEPGLQFNFLSDLCGVDYPQRPERFEVVYHLYSLPLKHRLRLKVQAGLTEAVPSVTGVWRTADWHERETYDLLGILFRGHPDLRRILLPDDWVGHPLRKEYPATGVEADVIDWYKRNLPANIPMIEQHLSPLPKTPLGKLTPLQTEEQG